MRTLALFVILSCLPSGLSVASEGRSDDHDVWEFATVVEDTKFSIQMQWTSSALFEEFSVEFFRELLLEKGQVDSARARLGGGTGLRSQRGIFVARISVHVESELDGSALGELIEKILKEEFEERGVAIVGRSRSGVPPAFSLYYETEERYGAVHCTTIPFEGRNFTIQFVIQESPLAAITHKTAAEADSDGNAEKSSGVEREP